MRRFRRGNVVVTTAILAVVAVLIVVALAPTGPCENISFGSGSVDPDELVAGWERESDCEVRTAESSGGFSSRMSIYEPCEDPDAGEIERNSLEMLVWEEFDPVWRRVGERTELRQRQQACADSPAE